MEEPHQATAAVITEGEGIDWRMEGGGVEGLKGVEKKRTSEVKRRRGRGGRDKEGWRVVCRVGGEVRTSAHRPFLKSWSDPHPSSPCDWGGSALTKNPSHVAD